MHLKSFLPVILWVLVILVLTGLPGDYFPQIVSFWDCLSPDRLIHLMGYPIISREKITLQDELSGKSNGI